MDASGSCSYSAAGWRRLLSQFDCLDYSSDAMIATDRSLKVMRWNRAAEALFGRAGQIAGVALDQLLGEAFDPAGLGPGRETACRLRLGDGNAVDALCRLDTFRGEDGAVLGCLLAIRRLSCCPKPGPARGQADPESRARVLESSEYDLIRILDGSTEGSWIWDIQHNTVEYSEEWKRRLDAAGLTGEPLFRHVLQRIHPDDRDQRLRVILDCINNRSPRVVTEYRVLTNDKGYIWVLSRGRITYDADGTPLKLHAVSIDISDRKNLETQLLRRTEQLMRKEEELLEILDCAAIGSWIVNSKDGTVVFSEQLQDFMGIRGLAYDEQVSKTLQAVHPDDRPAVVGHFNARASAAPPPCATIECRLMSPSGGYIWVSAKGKQRFGADGRPEKLYGVCYDVDGWKRAEIELIEKNRLIVDLFTSMSHELKTPLSIVQIDMDLITQIMGRAKGRYPERMNRYVATLRQNTYRLQRLIGNLLDLTKLDAGLIGVHPWTTDIAAAISELMRCVQEYARTHRNIDVRYASNAGSFVAGVDEEKVERVLLNLLSNAIKHTGAGGVIAVTLETQPGRIDLAVEDSGCGIPKGRQAELFDRFRQAGANLTRDSEGFGIGLPLTKALVELMGGTIGFASEPGRGATFRVGLPVSGDCGPIPLAVVTERSMTTAKMVEMEFSDIL